MGNSAAVFAGQGAQAVGMARDLAEAHAPCRELFETADRVLGFSLSEICFTGPEEALTRSNHCQPAIYVASLACMKALELEAGKPVSFDGTAGLSLGEWTALTYAGAITFEDGLRALEARGRFMQEACEAEAGGMVSVIGMERSGLDIVCAEAGVEIANINSEEQIVLSGPEAGIQKAAALCGEAGAKKTIVLNVAGAFHSRLMAPAAERLAGVLADIPVQAPSIPVASNVTGRPHTAPDAIRESLVQQVTQSVDWLGCIRWFSENDYDAYTEFGPGRVLSGLIRRIHRGAAIQNVQDIETAKSVAESLGN